ncbi:4Fe-4S binding protein [Flavobacteriaceae bacterium 3-367]
MAHFPNIKNEKHMVATANQAVAKMAYQTNEVCAIYPITPASEMSELVEEMHAKGQQNCFGQLPEVFEMQSEAGVAGAMHGALQTGSLATTFTASQGLLLMLPNMYKIAGELTPNVIHVATRSLATHALSVFGDHSDIMAARHTGYAFLGAASVQEAMDFALLAQAATLASRIPFVHFFDGFRTSHETAKIADVSDKVIREMIDLDHIQEHRDRALNPNKPVIRGTSQGADVFFQSREATNSYYADCPTIVQHQMDQFSKLTGRSYRIFDYVGHPEAEQVIIAMASATETIEETVHYLNAKGEKTGLIKVRLYRPFSAQHLISALPGSCTSIAVLDRTKEPGATGEPLYLDVVQSLIAHRNTFERLPQVVGGRYGLSSKEFTPSMVVAIINNLKKESPKNGFTVGIQDDLTGLSLPYQAEDPVLDQSYNALFYGTKSDSSLHSFNNTLQYIGNHTWHQVQGYVECDYKKSNSRSVANLRLSPQPIKAPYLISQADFVACSAVEFLENDNVMTRLKSGGTLLVHSVLDCTTFWKNLSVTVRRQIREQRISLYLGDFNSLPEHYLMDYHGISGLQQGLFAMSKTWGMKADQWQLLKNLERVDTTTEMDDISPIPMDDGDFAETLLGKLLAGKGDELPVSALPDDGTFSSDTAKFNTPNSHLEIPKWDPNLCVQCGACSLACPQATLRIKVYEDAYLTEAPEGLKATKAIDEIWAVDLLNYTIQVQPDQCTSCNNCVEACPAKALSMVDKLPIVEDQKKNWAYFECIPEMDRSKIDVMDMGQQQLQEPLFKYSEGVEGCGEAPYLKLISQLFGNRMLVANATGASSIFGGALPTTPWAKDSQGRGPAWSNSLFEDNAEFGLGFRLSQDRQEHAARKLLKNLRDQLNVDLVHGILQAAQTNEAQIEAQRKRVAQLKTVLNGINTKDSEQLLGLADSLVKKSVWIVGGDGWAYDIGYGGLDHVIASGKNVNILVMDNEVYSNTGGQMSKATPLGAAAKFGSGGKRQQKKDLGQLAMCYEDVYVASVAIGADPQQTIKALVEAEQYDGPSLIIAYCHSPAHGIDMKNPAQYHKMAVASGQWLLYRNDPQRSQQGLNTLQLDSGLPSLPLEHYLRTEERFSKLFKQDKDHSTGLMEQLQQKVNQRYRHYLSRAEISNQLQYEGMVNFLNSKLN